MEQHSVGKKNELMNLMGASVEQEKIIQSEVIQLSKDGYHMSSVIEGSCLQTFMYEHISSSNNRNQDSLKKLLWECGRAIESGQQDTCGLIGGNGMTVIREGEGPHVEEDHKMTARMSENIAYC